MFIMTLLIKQCCYISPFPFSLKQKKNNLRVELHVTFCSYLCLNNSKTKILLKKKKLWTLSLADCSLCCLQAALHIQYPSLYSFLHKKVVLIFGFGSFLCIQVNMEANPGFAESEHVSLVPCFRMYKNGSGIREVLVADCDMLENYLKMEHI